MGEGELDRSHRNRAVHYRQRIPMQETAFSDDIALLATLPLPWLRYSTERDAAAAADDDDGGRNVERLSVCRRSGNHADQI
jgi:hypothetical protein